MNTEKFEIIAKTFQGLEDVLAQEVITLGGEEVEQGKRMVSFVGDKEMLYKANLHLRTALRILKPIYTFTASNTDEVYDFLRKISWEKYISPTQTFSIDSVVFSDNFRHSKFVTYRAKDAIADYFQEKFNKRPSVRINNADLALNLHIAGLTCTLSLDSSGESLHKRGYRVDQNDAPLNEVLAAGMILKTGWRGEKSFFDPMCGSGTLLVEAAMIATNTPPGVYRQGFAFEKWADYDEELFDRLYNDESGEKEFEFKIIGSDISPRALDIARENIKSAGFSRFVYLKTMPFQNYTKETAPENSVMVMNPPYGERISSKDILGLYEMIGATLKHQFKGTDAWVLSYREECFEKIGLKPSVKYDLMNGGLDCEFRKYEIFEGRLREFKSEGGDFDKTKTESIESGDFKTKREIRKDRFVGGKKGGAKGGFKREERGSRPAQRENTFRKDRFNKEEGDFKPRGERSFSNDRGFKKDGDFKPRGERSFSKDRGFKKDGDFKPRGERSFSNDRGFKKDGDFKPRGERSFSNDRGFKKDGDFKPRGERSFSNDRASKYEHSGNFRRNADGSLELRTDGEFKPRGERTFNPNRPMFFPNKKEENNEGGEK